MPVAAIDNPIEVQKKTGLDGQGVTEEPGEFSNQGTRRFREMFDPDLYRNRNRNLTGLTKNKLQPVPKNLSTF
jgi:hypothetical protein